MQANGGKKKHSMLLNAGATMAHDASRPGERAEGFRKKPHKNLHSKSTFPGNFP